MTERPKMDFGAAPADDILPPDPNPAGPGQKGGKPAKGVLVATHGDTRLMTPGRQAFLEGRNPRAIRRRIMARIRGLSDGAAETLENLMNDPRDTRVQLQATAMVLAYTAGKPGETADDSTAADSNSGSEYARFLTPEEKDELRAAINIAARLKQIGLARMNAGG